MIDLHMTPQLSWSYLMPLAAALECQLEGPNPPEPVCQGPEVWPGASGVAAVPPGRAPRRTTRAPGPESGVRPRRVRSLPVSWQSLMGRVRGSGHASVDIKDHKS